MSSENAALATVTEISAEEAERIYAAVGGERVTASVPITHKLGVGSVDGWDHITGVVEQVQFVESKVYTYPCDDPQPEGASKILVYVGKQLVDASVGTDFLPPVEFVSTLPEDALHDGVRGTLDDVWPHIKKST